MKWARKRDANERGIIERLKARGCNVQQLDGSGVPDLLVQFDGELYLLEVKERGSKAGPAHRRNDGDLLSELTPAQVKFWAGWGEPKPAIVHDPEEAIYALGLW